MSTLFDRERDVQLLKYLPDFMQVYKELRAIMGAEEPEIKELWKQYCRAFRNNFIYYADEEGAGLFEKMMGIIPGADDDLDTRKNRILIKWNSQPPYTWRFLKNFLNSLMRTTANEPIRDLSIHELKIKTSIGTAGTITEIYKTLRGIIPANLTLIFANELNYSLAGGIYTGAGVIITTISEVKPDGTI